jgi:hypothetical protein
MRRGHALLQNPGVPNDILKTTLKGLNNEQSCEEFNTSGVVVVSVIVSPDLHSGL